jgi:hypothetical protein
MRINQSYDESLLINEDAESNTGAEEEKDEEVISEEERSDLSDVLNDREEKMRRASSM